MYNNVEMRYQLLHKTNYGDGWFNGNGYRKEHRGYWQSYIHGALTQYKIAKRINN